MYYAVDAENRDENGHSKKLFSVDENGIYDTDASQDQRKSLYLYPGGGDRQVLTVVNKDKTYGYAYNAKKYSDKVFFTAEDQDGDDHDNLIYMSVKKVQCEKADEGFIGTVVKDAAGDSNAEEPELLHFPDNCGITVGENYIGVLYERTDGEPDFNTESKEFVLLAPKTLDLTACTIENIPNGPLKRATFDYSTVTVPIKSQTTPQKLTDLPYPAEYTITEKGDPSYTFVRSYLDSNTKVNLGNPATITVLDNEGHTLTFVNKLDPNSDSPNLSIVNEYSYDYEQNKVIVQKKVVK